MNGFFNFLRIKIFSSKKIIIIVFIALIIGFLIWKQFLQKPAAPRYQTAKVTQGVLIVSLNESGQVVATNRINVITQASGTIDQIYVKNNQNIETGQKIASIKLDLAGQERQSQAWSAYLSAKSNLDSVNAALFSLQSTMFSKWNTYFNLAQNSTYQNADGSSNIANRALPQFTIAQDEWLSAEANYKNQQNIILQAQSILNNSWLSYQVSSAIITAPQSGILTDLTIAKGMQIAGSSGSAGSPVSQFVATVKNSGNPVVGLNLSEVDAIKIKAGQKVSLTFDALPNKTFTGKVLGINTAGVVTSGVATYPATILLDLPNDQIFPNMSANADIILAIKQDVLLLPTAAIQTVDGQSTVKILKNGVLTSVPIEIGESSDTETEIISGISKGQEVVIGAVREAIGGTSSSPFSRGIRLGGGNFGR